MVDNLVSHLAARMGLKKADRMDEKKVGYLAQYWVVHWGESLVVWTDASSAESMALHLVE